jgi:hypothetical protein
MSRWKNFDGKDCIQEVLLDENDFPRNFSFDFETKTQSVAISIIATTETDAWEKLEKLLERADFGDIELDSDIMIFRLPSIDDFYIQQE